MWNMFLCILLHVSYRLKIRAVNVVLALFTLLTLRRLFQHFNTMTTWKVTQHRTPRATSHHYFVTTVWWYNILYQTGYFLDLQRKTYIILDERYYHVKRYIHVPMIWRHHNVVRQRRSRATSRHSFITTVWLYNILSQTGYFL